MRIGLAVSAVLCVAELVGGWWTNSLALLTDAAHMLTDVGALALALFALWVSARPASDSKTFGYYRAEILAALVNGVVLWSWSCCSSCGGVDAPPRAAAGRAPAACS